MNKLITKPAECGYRVTVFLPEKIPCHHWANINQYDCPKGLNFPDHCPLVEGVHIPKTIEELILLAKKEGLLFNIKPATAFKKQTITLIEKIT